MRILNGKFRQCNSEISMNVHYTLLLLKCSYVCARNYDINVVAYRGVNCWAVCRVVSKNNCALNMSWLVNDPVITLTNQNTTRQKT